MTYLTIEVTDRKSFSEFMRLLLVDLELNQGKWTNNTLPSFLEALQRYSEDLDGYYKNVHPETDANLPSWRVFADIIRGGVMYE